MEMEKEQLRNENENIENAWRTFKNVILQAATEVCGVTKVGNKTKRTPWWNDEVKKAIKEKKEAWKKCLNTKTVEDRNIYKQKRDQARDILKEAKQQSWEKFGNTIEENFRNNKKCFWNIVKGLRQNKGRQVRNIRSSEGKVENEEKRILEVWKEFYERKFDENRQIDKLTMANVVEEEKEISEFELNNAIKKLRIGKAEGRDKIAPEFIKYSGEETKKELLKMLNQAYKGNNIPKDWQENIIVPIHKKGSTL